MVASPNTAETLGPGSAATWWPPGVKTSKLGSSESFSGSISWAFSSSESSSEENEGSANVGGGRDFGTLNLSDFPGVDSRLSWPRPPTRPRDLRMDWGVVPVEDARSAVLAWAFSLLEILLRAESTVLAWLAWGRRLVITGVSNTFWQYWSSFARHSLMASEALSSSWGEEVVTILALLLEGWCQLAS